MKKILIFWLLSTAVFAQNISLPVLRGGDTTAFNRSGMDSDYAILDVGRGWGLYKSYVGLNPASDSVYIKSNNTKWKLRPILSPTSVSWDNVVSKPTIYSSASALKTALESLTGSARLDTSAIKNLRGITSESDPNVGSHIKSITTDEKSHWNTSYGWGNHASAGYLTSYTETDPAVDSHIKSITTTNISDWTASYRTAAAVRNALATLSGTDRLSATYIKDLPSGVDISGKANIASPTFTGTPLVPTASAGTNTTQAASTAFVNTAVNTRIPYKTITEVRAFGSTDVTNNPRIYITDAGKEGEFRYNASNTTSTDNTGTVLVSGSYRYERVVENKTYRVDWFEKSTDVHTGQAIDRTIKVAVAALTAGDSNVVVSIGSGRNTVDTTVIVTAVPKWKKLTIVGEPGNIVDFYNPESGSAVFANNSSLTYADSSYAHGRIEIIGVNFVGQRNPVYSTPNASYGSRPLLFRNMQGVVIKGCTFRNIYGSGLAIGGSRSVIIEGNTFENVYAHQSVAQGDATGDAISIYAYVRNLVVSNNIMQLANGMDGRCGISVDDRSQNFIVANNVIQGYERGIHIEHCKNGVVNANVVTRSPIAGYSHINRNVIWSNNIFDGEKRAAANTFSEPGVLFALYDTLCTFRGNTVRNWSGAASTFLAKFWGNDLVIENNIFEPNMASAKVFGYGYNYRNTYRNNEFKGKCGLDLDYNYSVTVEGNTMWGGSLRAQNSTDALILNNRTRPDAGDNTGLGFNLYAATRPYLAGNTFIDPATYCIENSSTTNGIFEGNTYLRNHSSAAAYSSFYVDSGISATNVKKTAADRYNVVRDYINNNAYYLGNTGTGTAY